MLKKIAIGAALAASAMTAVPSAAVAGPYGYHGDRYYGGRYEQSYGDRYYGGRYGQSYGGYYGGGRYYRGRNGYDRHYYGRGYRRCSGTTGTIVGGAAGALLGREVAGRRGSRTTGTILGGALGALLGHEVGKSSC